MRSLPNASLAFAVLAVTSPPMCTALERVLPRYCRFENVRENLISLIFANLVPREFKVLAYIENT